MSKYTGHSEYELKSLEMSHNSGSMNMSNIFVSLNLFESIEDMTMSGNVIVNDTSQMTDVLPLYGNEKIDIAFHTSGNESNPKEFKGVVYKVSPRQKVNEQTTGFIIYFCSEELFKSNRDFVNKKYEDTIDSIVSSIFSKHVELQKPLETSSTTGLYKYTFGNINPLDAIQMMIPRATGGSGKQAFVFFENSDSFVFKPLQELYKGEVVASYGKKNAGVHEKNLTKYDEQFESYHDIQMREENSLLDRVNDGIHGSRHLGFDLITKEYKDDDGETWYNKNEWFSGGLGSNADLIPVEKKDDKIFLTYLYDEVDKTNHKNYIESKMKNRESDMFRANITVMGDSKLKCGDILDVLIPNWNLDQEELPTVYDGKVIIKKIWHMVTQTEYIQVIQINKDSYSETSV